MANLACTVCSMLGNWSYWKFFPDLDFGASHHHLRAVRGAMVLDVGGGGDLAASLVAPSYAVKLLRCVNV